MTSKELTVSKSPGHPWSQEAKVFDFFPSSILVFRKKQSSYHPLLVSWGF